MGAYRRPSSKYAKIVNIYAPLFISAASVDSGRRKSLKSISNYWRNMQKHPGKGGILVQLAACINIQYGRIIHTSSNEYYLGGTRYEKR
jgi:hypothetical protein